MEQYINPNINNQLSPSIHTSSAQINGSVQKHEVKSEHKSISNAQFQEQLNVSIIKPQIESQEPKTHIYTGIKIEDSYKVIHNALEVANIKGVFSLEDSYCIYNALRDIQHYIRYKS